MDDLVETETFTNAAFASVVSRIARDASDLTSDLAYGMWNPLFCSADASKRALDYFARLRSEIDHWSARATLSDNRGVTK